MSDLTTTARETTGGPVLELAGELDFHTAPTLRRTIRDLPLSSGRRLVLDLSGLAFCDSSGMSVFLAARNLALAAGADIALASVPVRVARILSLTGLDQVFHVHPDAEAALRRLGNGN